MTHPLGLGLSILGGTNLHAVATVEDCAERLELAVDAGIDGSAPKAMTGVTL